MKELTRIKLINWHYFENVTIEIKGSALITGDNGVGKSTILDAIQYVLVADLRKVKFNISAFEETKRDLAGYIRCKTGSDTEGGLRSLRSGDITSYVALEFYDGVKRRYFLLGVAVDSYSDGRTWDSKFFKVEDCRLEDSLFLAGRRPRNIRELKTALKEYKSRFYATVEEYQNDLLVKLGNLRSDRFFHLLVKAISFKPITDIRQFVYSYVLEEKHVNIEVMKENLQRYREYSDLAARTREKLEFLAGIIDKNNEIVKEQEKVLLQEYLIRRGARDHACALLRANLEEMAKNEQELQRAGVKLEKARENEDRSKKEYESYRDALAANSAFQLVERLKGEIGNLTRGREELQKRQTWVKTASAGEMARLEQLQSAGGGLLSPDEKMNLRVLGGFFRNLAEGRLPEAGESAAVEGLPFQTQLAGGRDVLEKLEQRLSSRIWEAGLRQRELGEEEEVINDELAGLHNKKHKYDQKVRELRDLISERFQKEKGLTVEPKVLCELLEVPDEKWQDAVEGWLNTQRFDLIVEPEHFDFALSVYERYKKERRISGVGLVNTARVVSFLDRMEPGCLAEEVRSENRYALAYVRQLMGNVIKCESERQLKQHRRAITPTCMTYVNNTARQIKFEVYETPFIGELAYARQISRKESSLARVKAELEELSCEVTGLESLRSLCSVRDGRYVLLQERLGVFGDLTAAEKLLDDKKRELAAVDTSGFAGIQVRMEALKNRMENLRQKIEGYIAKQAELKTAIESLQQNRLVLEREAAGAEAALAEFAAGHPEIVEKGAPRYEKELRRRTPDNIAASFLHNQKSLEGLIANKRNELVALKVKYNSDYHFGGRAEAEEIAEYLREHKKLAESELPEYEERINQAKREAEQEFKEHFIHKLRENVENARTEFNFLNDALKNVSFGSDSYRFLVEPSVRHRRFYEMIMDTELVEGGVSLFDSIFQERHREAMDDLFDKIVNTPAEQLPENVAVYTDYRTFLDYDIKITDYNGETSTFSKVCREKSGGETQTPYYVAIVASFVQLYRAKVNRDSIRLMMFDEAFNRMDSDRVENSLRFINELGMQVIIAAPTDKCEYIAPHVPTTLLVLREGHYSWIEDYKQLKLAEEGAPEKDAGETVA
ncbi:MAG: AAA family ATPase [Peptococcaceae bacterium]|nr:AAA family ATPase [Peptococcaceae bacterium]